MQELPGQNEERMTKRQRRELRRQEKAQERLRGNRSFPTGWVIGAVIVLAIGGLIWLFVAKGTSTLASADLTPMKTDTADPFVGNATSPVVVREFSDFQCPACKAAQPLVKGILDRFGDRIRFEYSDFPLVTIHKNALFAAEAAQCANDQGKFWVFHDKLFDKQSEWEDLGKNDANAKFQAYAADLGFDTAAFTTCVDNEEKRSVVQEDINQGNAAKVNATPTFFVNDEKLEGIPREADFVRIIENALTQAAGSTNSNQ